MPCCLNIAFPPNIARRAREEIQRRWPGVEMSDPDIHQEMFDFASSFGQGDIPALTVTAYPQVALRACALAREGRLARPGSDLPPLRDEYGQIGFAPLEEICIVGVVTGILVAGASCTRSLTDWADLCAPDFPGRVGCPPHDTPMPYLTEAVFRKTAGSAANNLLSRLDATSNPLDINKRLGRGELAAAVLIPSFARTFRDGPAKMVWPASGALVVPLFACLAANAPAQAHEILAWMLSAEFQHWMSVDGVIAPVRSGVPGFAELEANSWRLFWPGWELMFDVARAMSARSAGESAKTLI